MHAISLACVVSDNAVQVMLFVCEQSAGWLVTVNQDWAANSSFNIDYITHFQNRTITAINRATYLKISWCSITACSTLFMSSIICR